MSRFKLKVVAIAAACVLNAGLAVASSIWLYRRIYGHRSSPSNPRAKSDSEHELDAGHSDAESQYEDGENTETMSTPPESFFPRAPTVDDQSHRDDFNAGLEIGPPLPMTGSNTVNQPAHYASRRSRRSRPREVIDVAAQEQDTANDNIPNPVDIQSTFVSAEFHFEGNRTIKMNLVSHARDDQRQSTAIVLRSLDNPGPAFTVLAEYELPSWTTDKMLVFLQGLMTLWTHDLHGRCQKLSVNLPIRDLPSPELLTSPSAPLLPQQLKAVAWKGHHKQFGLFFSQGLPPSLRTLILRCKVSLNDCERLLYWGRNSLRKFDVHYIGRDVEDALEGKIEMDPFMDYLESISVVADWDIFSMFEYFHYPKLRELHITNSKPRFNQLEVSRYFANILRSQLTSTQLHCAMTLDEKDWLDKFRGEDDVGFNIDERTGKIKFDLPDLPNTF